MVGMNGEGNKLVIRIAQILGKSYNEVAYNMDMLEMIAALVEEVEKRDKMLKLFLVDY
jgi:adenylate kinase